MDRVPPVPARRPASDVSSGVGIAGLLGLFVWIAICRNWAEVAQVLALPGPRAPLSGPYAALATLLFTGVPMICWSLLVDKVHLRASTGIDWTRKLHAGAPRSVSVTKIAGLWATWAIIGFLYCVARWYWDGSYLFAIEVLAASAVPLVIASVPYVLWLDRYMVEPRDGAWHFGAMLIGREAFDPEAVRAHWRTWAVKGFFIAFMISILPGGFGYIVTLDTSMIASDPVRLAGGLIELLFLIDVQLAMVGYLVTFRPLDAHIRSANPHVAGWVAALICYPPFILMGDGGPLSYHHSTADWAFWLQGYPWLLWLWGAWLVFLTGCYAWATMIFGLRFSNLTYRGVITNGPYRFTRHPAYLAKNTFWWFATLPFLVTNDSMVDAIRNTVILAMVSAVYWWRAKTEEAHLLAEDAKYREYHAWMGENALISRVLGNIGHRAGQRGQALQPAE
jgi:protein-S-isoprenylcysteine O-methyltransferase Ste14